MTNGENTEKKRWKPRISHVLIALLLIVIAALLLFRFSLKSKFRAKLDAIRAAGYPVTCAELDDWYSIPAGAENAADYLIEAFSYYQEWAGEKRELLPVIGQAQLPPRTEPLSEETKAVINEYLADNQQALALLHKGATIKHCRYPVNFRAGLNALLPHLSEVKTCARLLHLEAILHAENDQPEPAVRSVISTFGVARSLSKEPMLISQLVRIACQALALQFLECSVNRTKFTDDQLAALSRAVAEAQDLSAMSRAFAGERCLGIDFFDNPHAQSQFIRLVGSSAPPAPLMILYRAAGLSDKDATVYLDLMEAYIKASQLPLHKRQKAARAVEEKLQAVPKIHFLLRVIMPALSRATMLDVRAIAHLRTAQVGLAIQRYRLATGKLPDTLADLSPTYLDAIPKDPFDGFSLRYKKLDVGFVVYSIGEDKKDDGGKEKPPRSKRRRKPSTYDVTFIIER